LGTQGWEKVLEDEKHSGDESSECDPPMEAIVRLGVRFKHPLESNGVDIEQLKDEFHDMITYASQFISLATLDYQSVWWRLYHAPNMSSWCNILQLVQLLFTLPASNGKLERVFSMLKLIKVDKRSSLGNQMLDDLLVLNSDRVSLKNFDPDHSISLWWNDKARRPNQKTREENAACSSTNTSTDSEERDTDTELLQEWDEWMNDGN
jgi:hypothetical protein